MTDMKPENHGFYWATVFLRSLWKSGLRHVIISPGSRSTPLTMAAAAFPQLSKHVILDERSAAFTALGIGKATNRPAALICTSGTAVANYLPAVIEARKSGVPMLLLSADRPPHLHGTGANQTINQHHIFGDYPVFFEDIGEPLLNKERINSTDNLGQKSYRLACERQGPVHLNFPFRKPLEPNQEFVQAIVDENISLQDEPATIPSQKKGGKCRFHDNILDEMHAAEQPLIVIGQLAPATNIEHINWLAEWLKAPVLSEQGSTLQKYGIQGFEGFLRNDKNSNQLEPDLILRFGHQPASKSLLQALEGWAPDRHIHIADTEHPSDIGGTTTDFIKWNGQPFDINNFSKKPDTWLQQWKQAEKKYAATSKQEIDKTTDLTDGHVYHHLAPKIPANWSVFFSNSFPARDHSMFGKWGHQPKFTNRGASGIDGITSTALGLSIGLNKPGVLFIGDLAFLHDTNALLNHSKLMQPLVVVVINNSGGSIFRMLPIAQHKEYFDTYFETPQEADITALAQTYGIYAKSVSSISELKKVNFEAISTKSDSRMCVIECKTDPDRSMELRRNIWDHQL